MTRKIILTRRRKLIASVFLTHFVCFVGASCELSPMAFAQPKSPSAGQLLREYRSARKDPFKQDEIVKRAVELGSEGARVFEPALARELSTALQGYRSRFRQAAIKASSQKIKNINPNELQSVRDQFSVLKETDPLTKAQIQTTGDRIIERLEAMFLIDAPTLLRDDAKLLRERAALSAIGRRWEQFAKIQEDERRENTPSGKEYFGGAPKFSERLNAEEQLAVRLALPMDDKTRAVLASNAKTANKLSEQERQAVLATNQLRILVGQNPLMIDLRLAAAARGHSNDMRRLRFFSHDSPVSGKSSPWDRAAKFGTKASAENIAVGEDLGQKAVEMWWYSPGHFKNLFGKHSRIGIGQSGNYWTQMFGR